MEQTQRVVILGGHGKVALMAVEKFRKTNFSVDAVIRNPDQCNDVEKVGGHPIMLDMESASIDNFADVFSGAVAVVFSAGAGGGNPKRTHAVDYEAAIRSMQGAEQAKVKRYVMVSYARVAERYKNLDPGNSFYPYCKAKYNADAHLRKTSLDYTILSPGLLTSDAATGKLQIADELGQVNGNLTEHKNATSRENVAEVIAYVVQHGTGIRQTVNFYDGNTPLAEALRP